MLFERPILFVDADVVIIDAGVFEGVTGDNFPSGSKFGDRNSWCEYLLPLTLLMPLLLALKNESDGVRCNRLEWKTAMSSFKCDVNDEEVPKKKSLSCRLSCDWKWFCGKFAVSSVSEAFLEPHVLGVLACIS